MRRSSSKADAGQLGRAPRLRDSGLQSMEQRDPGGALGHPDSWSHVPSAVTQWCQLFMP